nr:EOG090X0G74 [Sida crystallina]
MEKTEGDHDSGVDESTQAKDPAAQAMNPIQKVNSRTSVAKRTSSSPTSPSKAPLPAGQQKVPMNKIQVGNAPSPNLKTVTSKIGSMANAAYKPGGGNVKIESKKIQIDAKPRIGARNEGYTKSGGDKKIQTVKLQWNAQSKIGSLENATHKPGGGDKKIESRKLDFKDKAKSKVGSTVNIKHAPGGGNVKDISNDEVNDAIIIDLDGDGGTAEESASALEPVTEETQADE